MITAKIWLYDSTANEYKGEEYSQYLVQPYIPKEDLTDLCDTYELTLMGLPFRKEFAPETKFILEVFDGDSEIPTEHYDMEVEKDMVEQPILSDENYFTHHLFLTEPSVSAQKRPVDNISVTYKLQDVNLTETPATQNVGEMTLNETDSIFTPTHNFGTSFMGKFFNFTCFDVDLENYSQTLARDFNGALGIDYIRVRTEGDVVIEEPAFSQNYLYDVDEIKDHKITFRIPKCVLYVGQQGTRNFVACPDVLPIKYKITKREIGAEIESVTVQEKVINEGLTNEGRSVLQAATSDFKSIFSPFTETDDYYKYQLEKYENSTTPQGVFLNFRFHKYYDDSQVNTKNDENNNYYSTDPIEIERGYEYSLSFEPNLLNPDSQKPFENKTLPAPSVYALPTFVWFTGADDYVLKSYYSGNQVQISPLALKKETNIATLVSKNLIYQQSVPYSAYDLICKAIVNSHTRDTVSGVRVMDVNNENSPYPFYVDDDYVIKLSRTQIAENFYNQKNLWEILLEAGKYIQAIPQIVFGDNDKYKITFTKLGRVDKKENQATQMAINNFRGVEDYVSACSSYVTNMVQLNSTVSAWLVPKGDSGSDYLASNGEAYFYTPSPILEIVGFYVYDANNNVGNITQYVFEDSIYKVIGINKDIVPNKGLALHYSLGTNRIEGLNYRLPYYNTLGENSVSNYALKNIIKTAFPDTDINDIYINDYRFKLVYRTKVDERQQQVRPDLRKYLLSSKHDIVPYHTQFNNQQDTLVDSAAFGNNVYGKLIRTGNTNYSVTEWVSSPSQLKHKGELYTIDDDLYYVATAQHTHYADHIVSVVEFSKDFNQLSPVIGIPSEPRFYEISEQSSITRDVVIEDYLLLTTTPSIIEVKSKLAPDTIGGITYQGYRINVIQGLPITTSGQVFVPALNESVYLDSPAPIGYSYIMRTTRTLAIGDTLSIQAADSSILYDIDNTKLKNLSHITDIMFSTADYAKFVITVFRGDSALNGNSNTVEGAYDFRKEIISTAQPSSSENVLTYTWSMEDNFSAGDQGVEPDMPSGPYESAYIASQAVRYTDKFGKAAVFDFYIIEDLPSTPTLAQVRAMPENPLTEQNKTLEQVLAETETPIVAQNDTTRGLALLKDCREKIRFNYNNNLITDSDTFIPSAYMFAPNKQQSIKLVFLSEEVNKSNVGRIPAISIMTPILEDGTTAPSPYFDFNYIVCDFGKSIAIDISTNINYKHFTGADNFPRIRAVALVYNVLENSTTTWDSPFIIAKNLPETWTTKEQCLRSWLISPPKRDTLFREKQ